MKKAGSPILVKVAGVLAVCQIALFTLAIIGVLIIRQRYGELTMVLWEPGYATTQDVVLLFWLGVLLLVIGLFPLVWETLIARKTKHYNKHMYRLWLGCTITFVILLVLLLVTPFQGGTGA